MSRMHNPPHPGEIVKEYIPKGMTQGDVADCLDVSRQQFSAVINGRADITTDMGVRLAMAFDTAPEFWLNMQMVYNLWQVDVKGLPKVKKIVKTKAA